MSGAQIEVGRAAQRVDENHRPPAADRAYLTPTVKIPGYGQSPDRCQTLRPVGFCVEGHPVLGASSCETRGCPSHWRDGVERAVEAAVARLAAYRHHVDGWEKRMVHAVVSPPQGRRWSARAFYDGRAEAYEVAEEVGVRGGVCVPHPFRTTEELDQWYGEAVEAGAIDGQRGKWAFARDLAGEEWSDMERLIEEAPHYHTLAAAKDVDGEAVPEGWVVKNVRSFAPFYIDADAVPGAALVDGGGRIVGDPREVAEESYRDMASTFYYLLTHGPVSYTESGHSRAGHTYFGELHPSKFNPEKELEPEEWRRIQEMAAAVVGREPDRPGHGMKCPCEDCEAEVRPIGELSEWMSRAEWWSQLPPRRRNQLRALEAWAVLQVDRPPPSSRGSRERLESWLTERGALLTDADRSPTGAGTSTGFLKEWAE